MRSNYGSCWLQPLPFREAAAAQPLPWPAQASRLLSPSASGCRSAVGPTPLPQPAPPVLSPKPRPLRQPHPIKKAPTHTAQRPVDRGSPRSDLEVSELSGTIGLGTIRTSRNYQELNSTLRAAGCYSVPAAFNCSSLASSCLCICFARLFFLLLSFLESVPEISILQLQCRVCA